MHCRSLVVHLRAVAIVMVVTNLHACYSVACTEKTLPFCCQEQAVWLGGRHNMPHPVTLTFDLEVGVGVACDLGYPCAMFRLPRPFGFRVRADVRDIRQTDGRMTDADDCLMPPPYGAGA